MTFIVFSQFCLGRQLANRR